MDEGVPTHARYTGNVLGAGAFTQPLHDGRMTVDLFLALRSQT
ncbi:MAG: hypothetical protein WC096_04990 [Sphaerochaetaceae bacterium]